MRPCSDALLSINGFHNDAAPPKMGARDGQADFFSPGSRREHNEPRAGRENAPGLRRARPAICCRHGSRIRPLIRGERYAEASSVLARLWSDVDSWPAPFAGLVVVENRNLYVRSHSAMMICHESGARSGLRSRWWRIPLGNRSDGPRSLHRGAAVRHTLCSNRNPRVLR